jgi:DNA recombination protein RmuC
MTFEASILAIVLLLALGLGVGYAVGLLLERRRAGEAVGELRTLTERLRAREERVGELGGEVSAGREEAERLRREAAELRSRADRLESQREAEARAAAEKLRLLDEARTQLADTFKALSSEALKSNNDQFLAIAKREMEALRESSKGDLDQRQQAITRLVQPLQETLGKVDKRIEEVEKTRREAYGSLTQHLTGLAASQAQLTSETARLGQALRAPNVRGQWGEIQLQRVIEMAGMSSHCDFCQQETFADDEGRAYRPDVVVRLPAGRSIVIDSKAPLDRYLDSLQELDDAGRQARLKEHAGQIRRHLGLLSKKKYWDQLQESPEFVVLFLPGENFFSAALEQDPTLIEYGVDNRVILATPTTLIALLKAVAYGWRQERAAENAQKVSELGQQLHERLRVFVEHFARVGKNLDQAIRSYNQSVGSLENRVMVSVRRFHELGAAAGDEMPDLDAVDRQSRPLTPLAEPDAPAPLDLLDDAEVS